MAIFPPGANTEAQGQALLVGNPEVWNMPTPASYSTTQTFTAADIIGGIIVAGNAGAITDTLPTAALLVAALKAIFGPQLAIGATVGCLIVNGGSGIITIAAGSGGTFDTNQTGGQSISVGASKYVMLRLTNITLGSEAYTIYS
jgi:hypothetical protein